MTEEKPATFRQLGLDPRIESAVADAGYTVPTQIQIQAIPAIMNGHDITGIAQTGTGKTAAFVLPIIHRLTRGRARARMPRSLILCPTRELAAQVASNFGKYGANLKLAMALLIGGVSFKDQEKLLMRGVDILIATPGRLIDQFERGKILLTALEVLVIDEADRMLDMGFIPDIEKICSLLPKNRQTLLFSATMPKEIARLAEKFQKAPLRVEARRPSMTADTIVQHVVNLPRGDDMAKCLALRHVISSRKVINGIVFCNRKREVNLVSRSLNKHGFRTKPIHGDLPQSERTKTLQAFREGELQLLIASDVAARGLDIPDVGHVFNYAPPPRDEDYIHRIGRTGRAGRSGESFTLVGPSDEKDWVDVMTLITMAVADYMPDRLPSALANLPIAAGRRQNTDHHKPVSRSGSADRSRTGEGGRAVSGIHNRGSAVDDVAVQENKKRSGQKKNKDEGTSVQSVKGFGDQTPAFFH